MYSNFKSISNQLPWSDWFSWLYLCLAICTLHESCGVVIPYSTATHVSDRMGTVLLSEIYFYASLHSGKCMEHAIWLLRRWDLKQLEDDTMTWIMRIWLTRLYYRFTRNAVNMYTHVEIGSKIYVVVSVQFCSEKVRNILNNSANSYGYIRWSL